VNGHEDLENVDRDGWFVKAAATIGDLDNPFYRKERQRVVWNEASAVGLQLMLWLGLGTAAAMVWLDGTPALPYAFAVFVVLGPGGSLNRYAPARRSGSGHASADLGAPYRE
jgi:hypothetical protein